MELKRQRLSSKKLNKYQLLSVQKKRQITKEANIEIFPSLEKMAKKLPITRSVPNSSHHHLKAKKSKFPTATK
jgi:hypothetical protein